MLGFICKDCHEVFEHAEVIKNGGGDRGEHWAVCPYCHSTDYEEAVECAVCGEVVPESETHNEVCNNCLEMYADKVDVAYRYGEKHKECVFVNGLYADLFTPEEIESVLRREMRTRFDWEIKRASRRYCLSDDDDFADYVRKVACYEEV